MSRIGKKPIPVPAGVEVTVDGVRVDVKGPRGRLERVFPENMVFLDGEDRGAGHCPDGLAP